MGEASLIFLPWLRSGLNTAQTAGIVDGRRSVSILVDIKDEQGQILTTHPQTVTLRGPGDITGFSSSLIARTDPAPNANNFEPNYFPMVELADPDFLWRYSAREETGKLIPWLILIVLKRDGKEFSDNPVKDTNALPSIKVLDQCFLPDPKQSWAWAHVQISANIDEALAGNKADYEGYVRSLLAEHPELVFSRLLCPRQLEEFSLYSAFIVPVHEAGRVAGLGGDPPDNADYAWDCDKTNDKDLPGYYRWDFQTAEKGDFEGLIDRLHFLSSPPLGFGTRDVDGSRPGYFCQNGQERVFMEQGKPDIVKSEGALVPGNFMEDPAGRQPFVIGDFAEVMRTELNQCLRSMPPEDDPGGEDPLVTLPVYGNNFQKTTNLNSAAPWIREVNLDRRSRLAAATGTSIIQEKQEEFAKECWEQVGAIREANALLQFGAAACLSGENLKQRHLDPVDGFRFTLMTEACHSFYAHDNGKGQQSFKRRFRDCGLPPGITTYPFKRVIAGKLGMGATKGMGLFGDWLGGNSVTIRVRDQDRSLIEQLMKINPTSEPVQVSYPQMKPLKPEKIEVEVIDGLRGEIDVKIDILDRLIEVITLPEGALTSFDPIMASPHIDEPMFKYITNRSLDLLCPGLGQLPPNTAMLLEENRKFIEAFMVGLNHEMGRELGWREYPTDQRGTIFRYFWDTARVDKRLPDILDIPDWQDELGKHETGAKMNNLVLAIKGDLIRRCPDVIIFAIKSGISPRQWDWDLIYNLLKGNSNHPPEYQTYLPVFTAKVGNDQVFLGFPFAEEDTENGQYYFVFMDHPSLPRFGLDCAETPKTDAQFLVWEDLSWADVYPDNESQYIDFSQSTPNVPPGLKRKPSQVSNQYPEPVWGGDGAAMASITFQKPVRAIVPAASLLKKA
jgi:hypothetical protein